MSGLIPPPLRPEALNPEISPPVSAAIEKAMKVRRQERLAAARQNLARL